MEIHSGIAQENKERLIPVRELATYRLVALPEAELQEALVEEREAFRYGMAGEWCACLQIASFQANEMMEDILARWIEKICYQLPAQRILLNNYGSDFNNSVYLRVQDASPLLDLNARLRIIDEYISVNDCPPMRFPGRYGIVIFSGLRSGVFESAVSFYSRKEFNAEMSLKKLALLRKSHGEDVFRTRNYFRLKEG